MILKEVLALEKVSSSIKKIDLYISGTMRNSTEYLTALSYKAIIMHTLGKTNDALKLLFSEVPNFTKCDTDGVIAVCDAIIEICLSEDVNRFDQVNKYIELKRSYLPVSKQILYLKDKIRLYLASNDNEHAKNALLTYLNDDLTKEERIFAELKLSEIYYIERQYDKYLEIIPNLEAYYQTNLNLEEYNDIAYRKINIAYIKGDYLKVVSLGITFLNDSNVSDEYKVLVSTLMINSYVIKANFKQASILESEYEDLLDKVSYNAAYGFCKASLELYTKTRSQFSINSYEGKLRELDALMKPTKEANKKPKKKEDIVIPVIETNDVVIPEVKPILNTINTVSVSEEAKVSKTIVKEDIKYIKDIVVSENYEKLRRVYDAINNTPIDVKFREVLRQALMELSKVYDFDEAYLLYFKREYVGYQYKKERVYDKAPKESALDDTLNFASYINETELFIDPSVDNYLNNIVTSKPYEEIPYGIAIPLVDEDVTIGSLAFFSNHEFLGIEMCYETLKLVTSMLNAKLLICLNQEDIILNNEKLYFLNENMTSGVKEQSGEYINLSHQACKMLGCYSNITYKEYLFRIHDSYVAMYKQIIERIYLLMARDEEYEYDFKNDEGKYVHIKERFYPMVTNGIVTIYSIIDDLTDSNKEKTDLMNLAYTNPISKLDTEVKLMVDLANLYENKKMSLVLFEIRDFKLYSDIYGYNPANQIIHVLGDSLKRYFENDFNTYVYHLESDKFIILFNEVNDKRVIDSKLVVAFDRISKEIFSKNSRVRILFDAGVFRLGKNTIIDDVSEMLFYARDAIYDAKEMKTLGNHIAHFDSELHKNRFKENNLITHISEAIDHGKIAITYHQVVDIPNTQVYGYNVRLNLDNYNISYSDMMYVINRRGILDQIEKYQIDNVFKELKMFYEATKAGVRCFININLDNLNSNLVSFATSRIGFYKVDPKYIVFVFDKTSNPKIAELKQAGFGIASKNLLDVYANRCDYFFYNPKEAGFDTIKEIKALCGARDISFIVSNINDSDDMNEARRLNVDIISGDYYKKVIRMKNLIEKLGN